MNKTDFMQALAEELQGLPELEIARALSYYDEMLSDRVDDGLTEEEAVASLGDPAGIRQKLISEIPLPVIIEERASRPMRGLSAVLLALGFPLWFPLVIAFGAVVFSLGAALFSLLLALCALIFALGIGGIAAVVSGLLLLPTDALPGMFSIGAGLAFAGLSILLFYPGIAAGRFVGVLFRRFTRWVKSLFTRKKGERI